MWLEYMEDEPVLDWLRAGRRIRYEMLEDGASVAKRDRLYVTGMAVLAVLPLEIKLFRDEDEKVFVRESDVVTWKNFERWQKSFSKDSDEALRAVRL